MHAHLPDAVVSTPVFASSVFGRPRPQFPLGTVESYLIIYDVISMSSLQARQHK